MVRMHAHAVACSRVLTCTFMRRASHADMTSKKLKANPLMHPIWSVFKELSSKLTGGAINASQEELTADYHWN